MNQRRENQVPEEVLRIHEQWDAAAVLLAGMIQRLNGPESEVIRNAIDQVSPGALVQVEYMMIFQGLQNLSKAGEPLTHDRLLKAVRLLEPCQAFGFACMTLESFWEQRAVSPVSHEDLLKAVACLTAVGLNDRRAGEPEQRAPKSRAWWKILGKR
jgi:hypothetical protein